MASLLLVKDVDTLIIGKLFLVRYVTEFMTTYQFRGGHLLPTRGSERRGHNNSWGVVGGWYANNNTETLQGWKDDPLPHTLSRLVADGHLSTLNHLRVDALNAHHHERKKQLAAFLDSSAHAFSERKAAGPCGIPSTPDNVACTLESQRLNSVLAGHPHPENRRKERLDTYWSDGVARDGRGVSGGWSANQHPDVVSRPCCWQDEAAAQKHAQV